MKFKPYFLFAFLILLGCNSARLPVVKIQTELGYILIEADTINAPITAKNFVNLVKRGIYNGATFYRVVRKDNQPGSEVKIEVIQGGLFDDDEILKYTPIEHETTDKTGIKHTNGVVSMARYAPGTASTEFFICVGDQPGLDFGGKRNPDEQGFAAFGRVIKEFDVIKEIQQLPDTGQYLINRIAITKAEVLK